MTQIDRRISVEAARKILSKHGLNASAEEIEIILNYLYELIELAVDQVRREA